MMSLAAYRLALRLLALGVPRGARSEWLAEWTSELWYVREQAARDGGLLQGHAAMVCFCRGAIVDLDALREQGGEAPVRASRSATGCCVTLALLGCLALGVAHLLPGVRRAMRPIDRNAAGSVAIASSTRNTVALGAVRSLQRRPHRLFTDIAFYEPISRSLHLAPNRSPLMMVARSSRTLLSVLGVPVRFSRVPAGEPREPLLILSEATWRAQFAANRDIFGTEIKLGLQRARLAGVVSTEDVPTGQTFDAWLLMPDDLADTLADATPVFLVGRVAPNAELPRNRQRWQMYVPGPDGEIDYDCTSLASTRLETVRLFLFAMFLALLSLPATTSLSLGDYPHPPASPALARTAVRRWFFLAGKIALMLPAIYFGTLDVVYAADWRSTTSPEYLQLVLSFSACLFALRWALRDQRQRCPVCLGKLSCPARVGQPSRNFLAWNGIELICVAGHGLLHVPELPTSWCGTQRWLHLDASWSNLFFVPG